jgi:isopenicillin-N epimerase
MTTTDADWAAARAAMMLDPSTTNLNTGSFGPTPRKVFDRVTELRQRLAAGPMDFLLRQAPPLLWHARERLAAFLGAVPTRLAFSANVTAAINIVAAGLRLSAPGEILMSDREYGSMQWAWERAARRQHLSVRYFKLPLMPRNAGEIVDAVRAALTPRTRLLHFSHVLSATGLVLPAKELCDLARRHGVLTVIDGAHAPAMIPVAIDDIRCDFYGGNCHKWLLAPIASGFLALGAGAVDRLEPLQVSWGYHYDHARADERDNEGSTPRLRALEFEGTRDPCAWLAVPDAIDFQAGLGWDAVRARIRHLTNKVWERFNGLCGLRLATPADPALSGAMTAFWCPPGTDDEELRRQLWERRIEALVNKWPEGVMLRISTHFYTTEAELEELAGAMPLILSALGP